MGRTMIADEYQEIASRLAELERRPSVPTAPPGSRMWGLWFQSPKISGWCYVTPMFVDLADRLPATVFDSRDAALGAAKATGHSWEINKDYLSAKIFNKSE